MDAFTLQARLLPGTGTEQLAGGFTVAGASGKVKRLELAGEAGMTRQAFNLRQLRLTRPGRRGLVSGGGTVTLTAGEPLLALQVKAADLDLTPDTQGRRRPLRDPDARGNPGAVPGRVRDRQPGKGVANGASLRGVPGRRPGVKLAPLTGALLAGSVQGNLDIGWREEVSLEGTIRGRNLNPAAISPDWAGVVNFDLRGASRGRGRPRSGGR